MPEIKLVKKYPHIKDEDIASIFQEAYIKGFENGMKRGIPVEWIRKWVKNWKPYTNVKSDVFYMLEEWEKENGK